MKASASPLLLVDDSTDREHGNWVRIMNTNSLYFFTNLLPPARERVPGKLLRACRP